MPERTTLGLTNNEIIWLREHRYTKEAEHLTKLYNMAAANPDDRTARGHFDDALRKWRGSPDYLKIIISICV